MSDEAPSAGPELRTGRLLLRRWRAEDLPCEPSARQPRRLPAGCPGAHILVVMCGRYTNTAGPEELNDRFRVPIPFSEGTRRYNIAPTEQVLAIVAPKRERSTNAHEARLLRWGLVPHWAE